MKAKIIGILLTFFVLFTGCEEYFYRGTVFVKNSTGGPIWSSVTYSLESGNTNAYLYHNGQYQFDMNAGGIFVRVSIDGKLFYFEEFYLEPGEVMYIECETTNGILCIKEIE